MTRLLTFVTAIVITTVFTAVAEERKNPGSSPAPQAEGNPSLIRAGQERVNPGGTSAGGAKVGERKSAEDKESNVKVTQVPGGGIMVTIGEGGATAVATSTTGTLDERTQRNLAEAAKKSQATARSSMRERVERQNDLAKKAKKLVRKMDALGDNKKAEAHELWEELEQVQGQLRQTFGQPQISAMSGQPISTWVQLGAPTAKATAAGGFMPGSPLQLSPQVTPQLAPGATRPGQVSVTAIGLPPGASAPDLKSEVQTLRCQFEELRIQVQKLGERDKK